MSLDDSTRATDVVHGVFARPVTGDGVETGPLVCVHLGYVRLHGNGAKRISQ